jgi:branched-chain amino acid transport system permease protein
MTISLRNVLLVVGVASLYILEGSTTFWIFSGSWDSALKMLNFALIGAIMSLGVNLQWGFAGLFNIGIMGFVALGGLATVLISMPTTTGAWSAGGFQIVAGLVFGIITVVGVIKLYAWLPKGRSRGLITFAVLVGGFFAFRAIFDGGVAGVESINPAATGYLGGLNWGGENYRDYGWLTIVAWPVGGVLAAGAAWIIGKTALGLRSDYLAIATLGIAEIIIAIMKNEDWLSRGVKNVNGIPRPVPYEVDLQNDPDFVAQAVSWGLDPTTASTLYTKIGYAVLFAVFLIALLWLAQRALNSPWGRMMRAIRDNEVAAEAMGKNVTARHLQIFILGSAICGIAGAMMTTLDGQLTPTAYQPLRFTFLIWVMVIVGGSGNNFGAVLGGFLIWWLWVMVEPLGHWVAEITTSGFATDHWFRIRMEDAAAHFRLFTMGLVLLLVLRFSPRGLMPEK